MGQPPRAQLERRELLGRAIVFSSSLARKKSEIPPFAARRPCSYLQSGMPRVLGDYANQRLPRNALHSHPGPGRDQFFLSIRGPAMPGGRYHIAGPSRKRSTAVYDHAKSAFSKRRNSPKTPCRVRSRGEGRVPAGQPADGAVALPSFPPFQIPSSRNKSYPGHNQSRKIARKPNPRLSGPACRLRVCLVNKGRGI